MKAEIYINGFGGDSYKLGSYVFVDGGKMGGFAGSWEAFSRPLGEYPDGLIEEIEEMFFQDGKDKGVVPFGGRRYRYLIHKG